MTPQYQAFKHDPDNGSYGDCHRTAIACLLDIPRDEVPNFGEHYGDTKAFFDAELTFLLKRGLAQVSVAYMGEHGLGNVLDAIGAANPRAYYILGGRSRRGFNHSVIGHGDKIVWDPFPGCGEEHSIVGPCTDTYYWIQFLVPACMVST